MDNVQVGESYAQQSTSDAVVVRMELAPADEIMSASCEIIPHEGETSRVSKRSIAWTELETFVLLEAWGERLLRSSRRSVQSGEWNEVSEKVSEVSQCTRTRINCRNRLDTLKRLYKKEKAKFAENADYASDWVFFSKMDSIVSSSLNPGFIGIVNNEVYPSHTASSDEMRNELLDDSDSARTQSDNLEDTRPQKKRRVRKERSGRKPYKVIADCLNKFCDIYQKVEKKKIDQMFELEKMRMTFQKDLELERIKTLNMWQTEMAKIKRN